MIANPAEVWQFRFWSFDTFREKAQKISWDQEILCYTFKETSRNKSSFSQYLSLFCPALLGKNLLNLVSLNLKFHNQYCQSSRPVFHFPLSDVRELVFVLRTISFPIASSLFCYVCLGLAAIVCCVQGFRSLSGL